MLLHSGAVSHQFVTVPSGVYSIGKKGHVGNPRRTVKLKGFAIATVETTNDEFAAFVKATGYVTDAERNHNAMVFEPGLPEFQWIKDATATWRNPNGVKRDDIKSKGTHPVTSISFRDATAYCKWAMVRLPTLDEWEVASRAGSNHDHFFGEDAKQIGTYANIWHGEDHLKPDTSDGYLTTSPVGSFEPNALGLYDMYGNVFEFCTGKVKGDSGVNTVHARGGSWWCSSRSCCFFNSADIGRVDRRASFSNQGFRVVRDLK